MAAEIKTEEKKVSTPKKPSELKQPVAKNQIDVDFINKYFSYQKRLANYNYRIDKSETNKENKKAADRVHKEWLAYVEKTYDGKVSKVKTDEIIKHFTDTYYPNLPDKKVVVRGKFK